MPRKIAVQGNLKNIKKDLADLGYEIVNLNDGENVEAVVYMADGQDISYYNQMTSMGEGTDMTGDKGVLLINAANRTIEDIDYIINNRVYSRLF